MITKDKYDLYRKTMRRFMEIKSQDTSHPELIDAILRTEKTLLLLDKLNPSYKNRFEKENYTDD
jgi:hypothetical protein